VRRSPLSPSGLRLSLSTQDSELGAKTQRLLEEVDPGAGRLVSQGCGGRLEPRLGQGLDAGLMGESLVPVFVSGAVAAAVGVVSAYTSYIFGKRSMRAEVPIEMEKIRATARETRDTASWEYQLQAIKSLREVVGVPKTQIIESAGDLSQRLSGFLSRKHDWKWTWEPGYYRSSFAHLLARPLVWFEVLHRSIAYLDRSLGDAIEDEFRFLAYCSLLEDAFTDVSLFDNTGYNASQASAHVFSGHVRQLTSSLIRREDSRLWCVEFDEFMEEWKKATSDADLPGADLDRLVVRLGEEPGRDAFRLARLLLVHCRVSALLEIYHLPYQDFERLDVTLRRSDEFFAEDDTAALASNLKRLARSQVAGPRDKEVIANADGISTR
jgi:hypothetical protein